MSCPLTLAYLMEIGRLLEGYDKMRILYGTVIDHIERLKERAGVVPGTGEFIRLRAFYCIELMYSELIRKALANDKVLSSYEGSNVALTPVVAKLTEPTPRSWEGLGQLINRVDDIDGEITIRLTELSFAKKSMVGEAIEVMLEQRFNKTLKVFESCAAAAKLLRRALRNYELDLRPIGKALAKSVDILQVPHQERVNYGLTLLNISPDNPVTPWPTKTESQE